MFLRRLRALRFPASKQEYKVGGATVGPGSGTIMPPWEEVEMHRPRVPGLEGYRRPERAPMPEDLTRSHYQQFMRGRPIKFPRQIRAFVLAGVVISIMMCLHAFTMYKMRPDDFDWIEEERNKAEQARLRLLKRLEMQQEMEEEALRAEMEEHGNRLV